MTEEILNKAHDYARNHIERTEEGGYDIIEEMRLVDAYLAGAKDNTPQWHYIKDKDYPKCNELVIALDCKNEYAILYHEDLKDRGGTSWHTVERFTYARNIVAWQYLKLPKEMKC